MMKLKKISNLILFLLCIALLVSCSGKAGMTDGVQQTIKDPDIPVSPAQPEEPEDPDTRISFAAVGDMISYTGTIRDAKSCAIQGGREYNFAPIFENVRSVIEGANLAFINQETPLSEGHQYSGKFPYFNTPSDLGHDIIDAGFDIVNIATNHMIDMGGDGLINTIEFWKTTPATVIGGYLNEADLNTIRTVERDGIEIAFLSYTYSTNGNKLWGNYELCIPYIDEALIERQVKEANEIADLVFVSMHWGNENSMKQSPQQIALAEKMCAWGVDVVIGHHPHVLQPVEWIEEGGNKMLCIYSLGNFAAEQDHDYQLLGGIMTFDIVREKGEVFIDRPIMLPTIYYYDRSFYKNSTYLFEDFTEAMAKSSGLSYYGRSMTLDKMRSYVEKTISKEFLSESWQ